MPQIIHALIVQAIIGCCAALIGTFVGYRLLEWRTTHMETTCQSKHNKLDNRLDKEYDKLRLEMKMSDNELERSISKMCDLYYDSQMTLKVLGTKYDNIKESVDHGFSAHERAFTDVFHKISEVNKSIEALTIQIKVLVNGQKKDE